MPEVIMDVSRCAQCNGPAHLCELPDSTCRLKGLAKEWLAKDHLETSDGDDLDARARRLAPLLRSVEDGAWARLSEARTRRVDQLEARVTELDGLLTIACQELGFGSDVDAWRRHMGITGAASISEANEQISKAETGDRSEELAPADEGREGKRREAQPAEVASMSRLPSASPATSLCGRPTPGGPCTRAKGHLSEGHWHVGEGFELAQPRCEVCEATLNAAGLCPRKPQFCSRAQREQEELRSNVPLAAEQRLAALASDVSDHLPLRLFNGVSGTVGLRDRDGVCVADLQSGIVGKGRYLTFDRYVRDACNAVPGLLAELRRLREQQANAGKPDRRGSDETERLATDVMSKLRALPPGARASEFARQAYVVPALVSAYAKGTENGAEYAKREMRSATATGRPGADEKCSGCGAPPFGPCSKDCPANPASASEHKDDESEPYVCPGCHTVGGKPCAPGCIDDEIRRGREGGLDYGDIGLRDDEEDELLDENEFEMQDRINAEEP